jgi:hypothetical protein
VRATRTHPCHASFRFNASHLATSDGRSMPLFYTVGILDDDAGLPIKTDLEILADRLADDFGRSRAYWLSKLEGM